MTGSILKWLLILSILYVSIEAHAYGSRPQPAKPSYNSAKIKGPSSFSYVRPAARGSSLPRPAAKYQAAANSVKLSPSSTYSLSSASYRSSSLPSSAAAASTANAISQASNYNSGFESIPAGSSETESSYDARLVYYTTEPTYYTTTVHSYYAEHIHYSTEQPVDVYGERSDNGAGGGNYDTGEQEQPYTYVDPSTYFVEGAVDEYVTEGAYNGVPAVVDYATNVPAGPAGTDYVDSIRYDSQSSPTGYVEPTPYYTVAPVVEQFAPETNHYTEAVPVYDGQPSYSTSNDGQPSYPARNNDVYGASLLVGNDYTGSVPTPIYYTAEQIAAPNGAFVPANIQYGP